ncbi:MAG: ribonuclease HIII [Candidatus Izemoplasmatales bacterium]|jgi:ribonuclease HIII|nr:ribonuclease HIII [Candidatus Izemoplasmatales bacterium]MDD4595819.1 ribonuclease HIII [Candidatus Izemoplasmatales bacterium]
MNYIFGIDKSRLNDLFDYYKDYESTTDNPNALVVFRAPDIVITIYKTLKVMIQGSNAYEEYLMWSELLDFEPEAEKIVNVFPKVTPKTYSPLYNTSSFGSDEVGTGDFFGPVVVCTAFVEKNLISQLEDMQIRDSKQMSDETIMKIGDNLKKLVPHVILTVDNPKYNQLTKDGYNLNKIKAYLHNHAIQKCLLKVKQPYDYVILDAFCPEDQYYSYLSDIEAFHKISFFTKAESVHIAVATASVIARYTFLTEIGKINQAIGILLPLGAGAAVDLIGKRIVLERGFMFLKSIAKMNFKNAEKIKAMLPKNNDYNK